MEIEETLVENKHQPILKKQRRKLPVDDEEETITNKIEGFLNSLETK